MFGIVCYRTVGVCVPGLGRFVHALCCNCCVACLLASLCFSVRVLMSQVRACVRLVWMCVCVFVFCVQCYFCGVPSSANVLLLLFVCCMVFSTCCVCACVAC